MSSFWTNNYDPKLWPNQLCVKVEKLVKLNTEEQRLLIQDLTIRETLEIQEELRSELLRLSHMTERIKSLIYETKAPLRG